MQAARVDLPQPLSPTIPTTSPALTSRLTPSSAFTILEIAGAATGGAPSALPRRVSRARSRPNASSSAPRGISYSLRRSRTWSNGSIIGVHFSKGHRRPGPVELAEHGVITLNNDQRWLFHAADIHCSRAPRNKPTSDVRQQKGIRRLTAQRRIELRRSVRARDRTKQRLRVRMLRVLEDPSRRAGFDHVAAMHDRDPVAILGNRAEVVADQQDRDIRLLLHRAEEIENLRLGCHIQTGRRFVGDEQTW